MHQVQEARAHPLFGPRARERPLLPVPKRQEPSGSVFAVTAVRCRITCPSGSVGERVIRFVDQSEHLGVAAAIGMVPLAEPKIRAPKLLDIAVLGDVQEFAEFEHLVAWNGKAMRAEHPRRAAVEGRAMQQDPAPSRFWSAGRGGSRPGRRGGSANHFVNPA